MTDLSLVPWEEIQAEIARRFPAFVIGFVFYPDGHGAHRPQTRYALHGDSTAVIGLTNVLRIQAEVGFLHAARDLGPGNPPLDGPTNPL